MKNKILLFITIVVLSVSKQSYSQISITHLDMPSPGDTLRISYSTDTMNLALTDTNYTWNYTYLTPTSQWVRKFDAPLNFPSIFAIYFYTTASYGEAQYTPSTTIPFINITISNRYNFYHNAAPQFKQIGVGMYINSTPAPIKYTIADAIYQFPESYGKRDTCDSKYGTPVPGIGYYGEFIHRVNYADGWGTLNTPFGSFQALRIKSTLTIRDTIADTSGVGFTIPRPTQYEYKWLVPGGKIPYLQVNVTGGVKTIMYRDSMRAGVTQIGIHEYAAMNFNFQVFPNPASSNVLIDYSLDDNENVSIELFDIVGKKVCDFLNKKQNSGRHIENINLSPYNLQTGVYFVKMKVGNREGNCKIIVQ